MCLEPGTAVYFLLYLVQRYAHKFSICFNKTLWLLSFGFLSLERRLIWLFRQWRDASNMSPLPILPINQRCMLRHSVVPNDDCVFFPFDANMEICTESDMVIKEFQEHVTLFLLHPYDLSPSLKFISIMRNFLASLDWRDFELTLWIDEQGLFTCRRMCPHDRMYRLYRFTT